MIGSLCCPDPVLVALPRLPGHRGLGSGLAVRGAVAPPLVPPEKEKVVH